MAEDKTIAITFSELRSLIKSACELEHVKNALKAGVPNNYILSMLDGQKHWEIYSALNGPFYGQLDDETEENDGNS